MPDVGQTDGRMEPEEERQRKIDVEQEQPGQRAVVLGLYARRHLSGKPGTKDPNRNVADDEEGDDTATGHVDEVALLRRVAAHPAQHQ